MEIRRKVQLHPTQAEFRRSPARYRAFCGGRGAGKSWVGAYDLLRRLRPGGVYLVASPTGILMQDTTYPTLKQLGESFGIWGGVKLTPYPTITILLDGGTASIRLRTAEDPDKLRGPNLRGAWLDEASLMHGDAYKIVIGALRDGSHVGWMSATFTPQGPSHWTFSTFASGHPDSALFRARTDQNPFLSPAFAATLRDQYGETNWARQELGGEFVQLEGAEFESEWFSGPGFWFDDWPQNLQLKVVALDPSKGSSGRSKDGDYQAHVLIGVGVEDGRYILYVDADLDRLGVVPMCDRTVSLCRAFAAAGGQPVDSVICEENGTMGLLGPALDAACVRANCYLPYLLRTNSDNKEFRIRYYVGPPLSRRQLRFRRTAGARMLVGQLQSFPRDEYDDGPDALATGLRRVAELLSPGGE